MSRKPKFVLFDLGNVLVYIHPDAFLQTLGIDSPENRQYYHPFVVEIVKRYERGDDGTEQYLDRLEVLLNGRGAAHNPPFRPNRKFSRDELTRAMLTVIDEPVAGMEDLVRRVGQSVQVGLLSNTNPLHYEWCLRSLPVLRLIPDHLLSFELQALKPERLVFEKALRHLAFEPKEIFYVDDLLENVRTAQELGIQSYQFSTAGEFEGELKKLGLIG